MGIERKHSAPDADWFRDQFARLQISQTRFGREIGLNHSQISKTMLGQRRMTVAEMNKAAAILGVSLEELSARLGHEAYDTRPVSITAQVNGTGEVSAYHTDETAHSPAPGAPWAVLYGIRNTDALSTFYNWTFLVGPTNREVSVDTLGRLVVAEKRGNGKWLSFIRPGRKRGEFTLLTLDNKMIDTCEISEVAPVVFACP